MKSIILYFELLHSMEENYFHQAYLHIICFLTPYINNCMHIYVLLYRTVSLPILKVSSKQKLYKNFEDFLVTLVKGSDVFMSVSLTE